MGALESLANADAPREIVLTPREICAQVNVILFAQQESNACAAGRKQLIASENLIAAGRDCADTTKANQAEFPWQNQPVLQLSGEHIAIQVAAGGVAAKFIARTIDAIAIERR